MSTLQHIRTGATPRWDAFGAARRLAAIFAMWQARARARHELRRLDGRQLRDIGVSPAAVRREIMKPFWRD